MKENINKDTYTREEKIDANRALRQLLVQAAHIAVDLKEVKIEEKLDEIRKQLFHINY